MLRTVSIFMKNILVLGGTGFLGSNLLATYEDLRKKGDLEGVKFIVAGRRSPSVTLGNAVFCPIDIGNPLELRNLFLNHRFDEVFHLACSSVPSTSDAKILEDIRSNLMGTLSLLERMLEFGVRKIIFFSSGGTVYGDSAEMHFQEDRLGSPINSYGILKTAIEGYVKLYNRVFGLDYLILRPSHAFGLHHHSMTNGFINIAIRKALQGQTIQVWGDGNISKDYIFASDLAACFWKLYHSSVVNEVFNLGSGNSLSNNQILTAIRRFIPGIRWEYHPERSFDTKHPRFELDKLNAVVKLDVTPLEQSLQQTYHWERSR
jgi:UDP-glucose 4-epimerase